MKGPWMDQPTQETNYKYNGIEKEEHHGLNINIAAYRVLDPAVGQWCSVDPKAEALYGLSPYNSMGNNPISYSDPEGDLFFVPILVGAAIGAGVSGATTIAVNAINGNNLFQGIGKAMAFGAVGGAIGAGVGAAFSGTAFGQSTGFGILNNVASNAATSAAFGQDITLGSLAGGVAGGIVGGQLPGFTGVKGGAFANAFAEIGHKSLTGAITGAVGGGVAAAVDRRDIGEGILNGAKYGAIGGGTQAGLNILTMGTAYKPERSYGFFDGEPKPVYRTGTFISGFFAGEGSGITLGRNLLTHQYKNKSGYANQHLRAHETAHFIQQRIHGFGKFYGRTAKEYLINPGFKNVYGTRGTFEYQADQYATNFLRLWP